MYVWAIWAKSFANDCGKIAELWRSRDLAYNRMVQLQSREQQYHWSIAEHRVLGSADYKEENFNDHTTGNNTPPSATPDGEITPKCRSCIYTFPCGCEPSSSMCQVKYRSA